MMKWLRGRNKLRTAALTGLIALLSISLVGCGASQTASNSKGDQTAGAKYVFKVGHAMPASHPFQKGLEKFAELASQKTNGQVEIQVFPSGELGGTRDRVESVKMGTGDMELSGTTQIAAFIPQFAVMDLPFLFKSYEHVDAVMDGDVGQKLDKLAEQQGLKILGWEENGFRNVFNALRPINTLDDLKGLKLRVYPNQAYVATFKDLGALPMTTDWGELYTALSQGTVDGAEAAEAHFITNKFYEAHQKYFSITHHMYVPMVLIMNKAKFDKLPADIQKALVEAGKEAATYERTVSRDLVKDYQKQMEEKGVKINEIKDLNPFIQATKPVYDEFAPKIGQDLIDEVINADPKK